MNIRTLAIASGIAAASTLTALTLSGDSDAARRTITVEYDDTNARWVHFNAHRMEDGGARLEPFCIEIPQADGGFVHLRKPCAPCEAGGMSRSALDACVSAVEGEALKSSR